MARLDALREWIRSRHCEGRAEAFGDAWREGTPAIFGTRRSRSIAHHQGHMNSGFKSTGARISLTAKELATSVAWYRDVLGFEVLYQSENSAGVKAGNAFIYLNQDDGKRGWDRVKGEGFALQFAVEGDV